LGLYTVNTLNGERITRKKTNSFRQTISGKDFNISKPKKTNVSFFGGLLSSLPNTGLSLRQCYGII